MENTFEHIEHLAFSILCEETQLLVRIESLGQGLLSDVDSVTRFREGQKQKLVRRTKSAFQREAVVMQRETTQFSEEVTQTLQEITQK